MQELMGVLQLGGIVALVLLAIVGLYTFRDRLRRESERERLAEAAFQATLIASVGLDVEGSGPDSLALSHDVIPDLSPLAELSPSVGLEPAVQHVVASQDKGGETIKVAADAVMTILQRANLIEAVEGYMELNGDPRAGVMLLLRNRRRALLVPYHETDAFTARNLKRFDFLIFVGRDGKGVVVNPLETLISEEVTRYLNKSRG